MLEKFHSETSLKERQRCFIGLLYKAQLQRITLITLVGHCDRTFILKSWSVYSSSTRNTRNMFSTTSQVECVVVVFLYYVGRLPFLIIKERSLAVSTFASFPVFTPVVLSITYGVKRTLWPTNCSNESADKWFFISVRFIWLSSDSQLSTVSMDSSDFCSAVS